MWSGSHILGEKSFNFNNCHFRTLSKITLLCYATLLSQKKSSLGSIPHFKETPHWTEK